MLSSVLLSFSCPRQFILINYEKNDYKKYIYIKKILYSHDKAFKNTIFRVIQVILSNTEILWFV